MHSLVYLVLYLSAQVIHTPSPLVNLIMNAEGPARYKMDVKKKLISPSPKLVSLVGDWLVLLFPLVKNHMESLTVVLMVLVIP